LERGDWVAFDRRNHSDEACFTRGTLKNLKADIWRRVKIDLFFRAIARSSAIVATDREGYGALTVWPQLPHEFAKI
jgi:hypothetical protein